MAATDPASSALSSLMIASRETPNLSRWVKRGSTSATAGGESTVVGNFAPDGRGGSLVFQQAGFVQCGQQIADCFHIDGHLIAQGQGVADGPGVGLGPVAKGQHWAKGLGHEQRIIDQFQRIGQQIVDVAVLVASLRVYRAQFGKTQVAHL